MTIRKAKKADSIAIRKLIKAFPDKLLQDHLPPLKWFFVCEEGKELIACCALEIYSERLAEIRSLAVARDYQGKGYAKALIERCIKEARKKKVYEVLSVTGAVSLFEKNGFRTFNNEKYALLKILR